MAPKILCTLIILFLPLQVLAACGTDGFTVVYVNGILTDKETASSDAKRLEKEIEFRTDLENVKVVNGYNPSHLAGLGDLIQSVAQIMGSSVSSFDLNTILLQIHPQVTTRKLLLVGHSQGTFYANAMYDYLLAHGEPREAVGVYAVATPASSVAGGGRHLNSTNDSLLNNIDAIAGRSPLSRNITLPIADADKASPWPGHGLSRAYLAQGAERVVGDIKKEVDTLKPVSASETGECFTAPSAGLGYQAAKAGFAVADTTSQVVKAGLGAAQAAGVALGDAFLAAAGGAWGLGKKVVADIGITAGGISGLSRAATDEVRPTNFDIVQRLYGSSLTKEDIKELLGNQGSAVATAPIFTDEPEPLQEFQDSVEPATSTPKIIYLSGSGGSSPAATTSSDTTATPGPVASTTSPAATSTDPVATSTDSVVPPAPSALLGALVLNEVAWAGTYSNPAGQWVELYNASSSDINLASTSLVVGDSDPVALSGTIEPHRYVVVQRVGGAIEASTPPGFIVADFGSLSAGSQQITLLDSAGRVIDATPEADACGGSWCAGSAPTHNYADALGNPIPVSMERIETDDNGDDPDNWASNDGYTRQGHDSGRQPIIGTPRAANSKHWPLAGFFCGDEDDMLVPSNNAERLEPEDSDCTALYGAARLDKSVGGAIFIGEVGSSSVASSFSFTGRFSGGTIKVSQAGFDSSQPGEYFVALWEYDNNVGGGFNTPFVSQLQLYLTTGAQSSGATEPPPLTFVTIPFTLE